MVDNPFADPPPPLFVTSDGRTSHPLVQNGVYTVSHPVAGHFTIKLETSLGGKLRGWRILSVLTGPNNDADYTAVAFWVEGVDGKSLCNVWRKFRGSRSRMPVDGYHWQREGWSKDEKKLAVWLDLAVRGDGGYWVTRGYVIKHAGTCVRCNRTLTTPESIANGIGPVCAERTS